MKKLNDLPDLLTVTEVADVLRTSTQTVLSALKNGGIEGVRPLGANWRIPKENLIKCLEPCKVGITSSNKIERRPSVDNSEEDDGDDDQTTQLKPEGDYHA